MVKPRKIVFQLLAKRGGGCIVLFCETSELENQGEWYKTTSFLLLLYTVKEKSYFLNTITKFEGHSWHI